jgi:hypothetical protein
MREDTWKVVCCDPISYFTYENIVKCVINQQKERNKAKHVNLEMGLPEKCELQVLDLVSNYNIYIM